MEWIKCSERLPPENQSVLSYCPDDYDEIKMDYLIEVKNDYIWCRRVIHDDNRHSVTHWMPLPEKPKE